MTEQPRTIRIDRPLQRGLVNDATLYTATRPLALIAYAAMLAAAGFTFFTIPAVRESDPERATTLSWTVLAFLALIVASIVFTRAQTRRAIDQAMPLDSVVRVEVGRKRLLVVAKRGVSNMPYSRFRAVHAGRHAVLLRLRETSSVVTAVPRALISDDEIALMKQAIG